MIKLSELHTGEKAVVKRIDGDCERLKELGFTLNATVEVLFCAPTLRKKNNGMKAYSVRGAVIALRTLDAERIEVLRI